MAKYTVDQLRRWNSRMNNDFQIDLQHLMIWNEKRAVKEIKLEDNKVLRATISWTSIYEGYRDTGMVKPEMHLSIWHPTSTPGMMCSHGMGATVKITEDTFKRRVFNELAKYTAEWNEDRILEKAKELLPQLKRMEVCV